MTTTPTASPELPDLDHLEALARAADQGEGQHIYTNPRDSNGWQANEAWHLAASPAAVLDLIALARRAQPEGEAPQAEPVARVIAGEWGKKVAFLANGKDAPKVGTLLYTHPPAATLSPLCGAQPAESGKETAQLSIGFANNDQGVHVSVMQQHAGGAVTLLHQAKVPAGDSFTRFAVAAQQAAAPTWGAVHTVGDMVRNLLTLDQAAPIFTAFHVTIDGERRCRTREVIISKERVVDGKWIDSARKDVPYTHVIWAKPDESDREAAAPGALPERDLSKPAEQQGLFRKFDVRRTDGSDQPGEKHHGCRYYVLDLTHDQHAPAAMRAYGAACASTHPQLAADIVAEFGAPGTPEAPSDRHPVQPLIEDEHGRARFKENAIVRHLSEGKLNELAAFGFPETDWEQFAQLIGYSLDGFGTLSYVTNETYDRAAAQPVVQRAAQLDGGQEAALTRCAAGRDGECGHKACPQLRDKEPAKSGRHCPLDQEGSESNG